MTGRTLAKSLASPTKSLGKSRFLWDLEEEVSQKRSHFVGFEEGESKTLGCAGF